MTWFVTAVLGNAGCEATVLRDIGVQPLYFVARGVNRCLHVVCTVVFVARGVNRCLHVACTVVFETRVVYRCLCDACCVP